MQQNNYIEAEDAYRRALVIAPDNNKMCNLGICLMKQGRVGEAKDTLRRVKPAVVDGPRGVDSHLKAYERAQQMLRDLESKMMNKGGDRIEQSKLFDAFLGSSAIWQPQPCKEHNTSTLSKPTKSSQPQDEFANENINSTNSIRNQIVPSLQKSMNPNISYGNLLNIDAPPFYSSKITKEPANVPIPESLKRTRSGNETHLMIKESHGTITELENKMRKQSISPENTKDRWAGLLPDSKDFEDAMIAAALGSTQETFLPRNADKRLRVFQDITLSMSPSPRA